MGQRADKVELVPIADCGLQIADCGFRDAVVYNFFYISLSVSVCVGLWLISC